MFTAIALTTLLLFVVSRLHRLADEEKTLQQVWKDGVFIFQVGKWPTVSREIRARLILLGEQPHIHHRDGMTSCVADGLPGWDGGFAAGRHLAEMARCRYLLRVHLPSETREGHCLREILAPTMLPDPPEVLPPASRLTGELWWTMDPLPESILSEWMKIGPFIRFQLTDLQYGIQIDEDIPGKLLEYRYLGTWLIRKVLLDLVNLVREERHYRNSFWGAFSVED